MRELNTVKHRKLIKILEIYFWVIMHYSEWAVVLQIRSKATITHYSGKGTVLAISEVDAGNSTDSYITL